MADQAATRARAVAAIAIGLAALAGCTSGGGEPGGDGSASTSASASPSETEGSYREVDKPCEVLDDDLYEDIVGLDPRKGIDDSEADDDMTQMTCRFESLDIGKDQPEFSIEVMSRVFSREEAAERDYDDALGLNSTGVEDMTGIDGPWQDGAWLVHEETSHYLLVARDDNLAIGITVYIRPLDGLKEKKVMELMTTYAGQTMTGLKS